jgi:hypothetical protein
MTGQIGHWNHQVKPIMSVSYNINSSRHGNDSSRPEGHRMKVRSLQLRQGGIQVVSPFFVAFCIPLQVAHRDHGA